MLSILIPIFNFDVRNFVSQLSQQATEVDFELEIICLDDGSKPEFLKLNEQISTLPKVEYKIAETNLGRSAIRNRLAQLSKFENLLFLDCDGECVSDQYLAEYAKYFESYDVIYGGRVYQAIRPKDQQLLFHWVCGKAREEIGVSQRLEQPYKSFMTNNFLIRKSVYDQVKMDESINGYGHEDTFFAIQLKKNGFSIDHIHNPIMHIGLEPTDVFLQKSENGVKNLAQLYKSGRVSNSIKLIRFYEMAAKSGLIHLIRFWFSLRESAVKRNFHSTKPNLLWFDVWKLSLLRKYLR